MGKTYCFFAGHYLPHLGGVERYVYNLGRELLSRGNRVIVVTSQVGGLPFYEKMDGIQVFRLPCYELLNGRYPILKYNKTTRRIMNRVRKMQPDYVVVNTRFYLLSVYAVHFARMNRMSCCLLEHGTSHVTIHNRFWDTIGHAYEHFLTWCLRIQQPVFLGTCKACNEWLAHFHIKSDGVVYNAIDIEDVQKCLELPGSFRYDHGISDDRVVITFTGRLLKEKGVPQLIEAVKRVHKIHPEVALFIAGDGDLDAYVTKEQSDYIIPLGRIAHEDVYRLLDESDIYCLPSVSEAFCGGVLEAVACECFIITTRQGGIREIIDSSEFGMILDDNRVKTVEKALLYAVEHPEYRATAISNTYKRLMEGYSWPVVADEFERLCNTMKKH